MPSEIERLIGNNRAALLRRDRSATIRLVNAYAGVYASARTEIDDLAKSVAARRARGLDVSEDALRRDARLRHLLAQVEAQLVRWAGTAGTLIAGEAHRALGLALEHSRQEVAAIASTPPVGIAVDDMWAALPVEAVETVVATTGGAPLQQVLERVAGEAAPMLREHLVRGLALGRGPRQIASIARGALAIPLDRTLRIARTEIMRAYRTATQQAYSASPIVSGWTWIAALDGRTCAVCYEMHGSEHTDAESLDSHVQCRCTQAPNTRSWEDIGFQGGGGAESPSIRRGADVFRRLPARTRREILGPAKARAYDAKELQLSDLVRETHSAAWGAGKREASLREVLGQARAGEYVRG